MAQTVDPSGATAEEHVTFASATGKWVLFATVTGSGMAFLDSTVVNVALPAIGKDLGADVAGLQWIVNGYMLALAALILLGGSLGDRYGRRRVFQIGVIWFALASLACALAFNVPSLVAARIVQGIGGALLTPGSLAIIEASFAKADRARAIGAWAGLTGVGAAIGPFIGGWLVDIGSWPLVFLLNLPLAIGVIWATARHVPESRDPAAAPHLDIPGAVTGAVGLGGLTYALIAAGEEGPTSAGVLITGAVGIAGLIGFVVVERTSRSPMLPPGIFRSRQFTAANLVTASVYAALGAVFFLFIIQLQQVVGYSALQAGLAALPVTLLMLLLSPRSGALAQRIGPRPQMTVGPLLLAGSMLLMLRIEEGSDYVTTVFPAVALMGFALAVTVAPLTATVLAAAEERHAGIASGVNNTVARAAQLAAVAVVPVVAGLTGDAYQDPERFSAGFQTSMWILAALSAVGGVTAWATIRNPLADRGDEKPLDEAAEVAPHF